MGFFRVIYPAYKKMWKKNMVKPQENDQSKWVTFHKASLSIQEGKKLRILNINPTKRSVKTIK